MSRGKKTGWRWRIYVRRKTAIFHCTGTRKCLGSNGHYAALKNGRDRQLTMPTVLEDPSTNAVAQLSLNSHTSSQPAEKDGDGVIRRDTILSPEERNARLDEIAEDGEEAGLVSASAAQSLRMASQQTPQNASSGDQSWGPGWGRPFKVEWLQTCVLRSLRVGSG